jgi:hypothetical protein
MGVRENTWGPDWQGNRELADLQWGTTGIWQGLKGSWGSSKAGAR